MKKLSLFGFSWISNKVEINNVIKKAKIINIILSFLTKYSFLGKEKTPIIKIRKIIAFVKPFPTKKEIGRQKYNMLSSLKFISVSFLDETKDIFCINTLCYTKYLFNKNKYKVGV